MLILDEVSSCNSLFTPEGLNMIREILGWVRIIAPILLILLISLDFASVVFNPDAKNNALFSKIAKRMIAVVLLFFVPTIVRAIFNMDGIKGLLSDDPLCTNATGTEAKDKLFFSQSYDGGVSFTKVNKTKAQVEAEEKEKKKKQQQSGQSGDSDGEVVIEDGDNSKRSYKTITINGRTYDVYLQRILGDIPFDGCNLAQCGCSAMAFATAASGFDRSITAYEAAKLVKARSFDGIKGALNSKGIPYSGPYYYNSNDRNESRVQALSNQIREHLAQGKPVICLVAGGPYANANHFITLLGEENGEVIIGNCRKERGTIEEIVRESMCGGRKGALLVG